MREYAVAIRLLAVLALQALWVPGYLVAWEWPVPSVQPVQFFGGFHGELPFPGIRIAATEVSSIHDGRVVMARQLAADRSLLVIAHGTGFHVAYDDLLWSSLRVTEGQTVRAGDPLGRSSDGVVGIRVFDSVHERIINPLHVLPDYVDRFRPVIDGLWLRPPVGDVYEVSQNEALVLPAARYMLELSAYDRVDFTQRLQVYGIEVFVNGRQVLSARLDGVQTVSGGRVLMDNSDLALEELLTENGLLHAGELELLPGEATIDVVAYDFIGNQARARFVLVIEE